MRFNSIPSAVLISACVLAGCGGTVPAPKKAASTADATNNSTPGAKPEELAGKGKEKDDRPAEESAKKTAAKSAPPRKTGLAHLFRVPEIPQEMLVTAEKAPEKKPDAPQKSQPRVRLLGFAQIDEQRKALVEMNGNVHWVAAGDLIDGVEVVEIVEQQVTFQFAKARWTTPLFQQAWFNEQAGGGAAFARSSPASRGGVGNPRSVSTSTRATSKPPKAAMFSSNRPADGAYGNGISQPATGGNIPGIPGIATSGGIPGMAGIPGMPTGDPTGLSPTSSPGAPSAGQAPAGPPGMPAIPSGPPSMPSIPSPTMPTSPGAPSVPGGAAPSPGGVPSGPSGGLPSGLPSGPPGGLPTGT